MTEMKRSVIEVILVFADNVHFLQKYNMECSLKCLHFRAFLYIPVHWNARMTEMKRSVIEVILVFADNVHFLQNHSKESP
ncbi:hypothetical protein D3Z53_05330 [Lachnospiraceae bacterium]|nr:hypothetical protein [Lachnospiraceae bacterium]